METVYEFFENVFVKMYVNKIRNKIANTFHKNDTVMQLINLPLFCFIFIFIRYLYFESFQVIIIKPLILNQY